MRDNYYSDGIKPVELIYSFDDDTCLSKQTTAITTNVEIEGSTDTVTLSDVYIYNNILSSCKDIKINNYSCLFVTNQQHLDDNIDIPTHYNPYTTIDYTNGYASYNNVFGDVTNVYNGCSNNLLLNVQYTTIDGDKFPCNLISFNNQKSYTNRNIYTNYWKDVVNYYDIQAILTGTRQEHGNTDLYTVDEFYMQDIEIKPGDNKIKLPDSLFPFEALDINDTTFISNGAFGSTSPSISDRIYTNRYPEHKNNTIMLCTWLSCNTNAARVSLYRYYNPSVYHYTQVLNAEGNIADAFNSDAALRLYGYFDKQSDLVLSSNMELTYHRTSYDDINNYISTLDSTYISAIALKNKLNYNICVTDYYKLSGDIYGYANLNNTLNNNFAISFDIDVYDWINANFYELFSSHSNNCGIRLYKKNPITPILLAWKSTKNNTTISLFNTQFNKIDEFYVDGDAIDVKRDENLSHIIVLWNHKVCIYNLFGALLYEYVSLDDNYFTAIDVVTDNLYIVDNSYVYCYNINTFEKISQTPIQSQNVKNLVIGGDSIMYGTEKCDSCVYVENANGMLYLYDGIIYLCYNNSNICKADHTIDSKYLHIHTPKYVDEETRVEKYDSEIPILDFTINSNILYAATLNTLFIGNVDRTNIVQYELPQMVNGNIKDSVNIVTTTEIQDSNYVNNVFVLIGDKYLQNVDIFKFENTKFEYIKTITQFSNYNLFNLTGSKNILPVSNTLYFDIAFKKENNKTVTYSLPLKIDVSSGKHTILINVNTKDKQCELYIDDINACTHKLQSDDLIYTYNILQNQIVLGNTLLYNGGDLASYIQSNQYMLKDISIGNLYIYNRYLTDENIRINALKSVSIPSIILTVPCGQRCKITHIESFYKQTVPGYKSTNFDIIIKNLQLSEQNQLLLSNSIKKYIENYLPTTTHLDNITFKNY